ncbi:MAG: DUF3842 family protein [Synergistaceae bacterium]|jgi:hypothetical protein|nr:DUF3842 family protein [Synergistaceae bacterium]
MKIVVIDGQGGALGKSLISVMKNIKNIVPECEIMAVGTNNAATVAMLGAGADNGATGENPVVVSCRDADIVIGPVGILSANSMFGEVTPAMAKAVGECRAKKFLIPVSKCDIVIVGAAGLTYTEYVKLAAELVLEEARGILAG